jgi:hypothetical protein
MAPSSIGEILGHQKPHKRPQSRPPLAVCRRHPFPPATEPQAAPEAPSQLRPRTRRSPVGNEQTPPADTDGPTGPQQTPDALRPLRPRRRATRPQAVPAATRTPDVAAAAETPSSEDTDTPADTRDHEPNKEDENRLELTGRLGRDPHFRTTASGTLVGKFPLAVHDQDGKATWHDVVVYGKLATRLQERLAAGENLKGNEVQVTGYEHTREKRNKDGIVLGPDGQPKIERYINAVAVVNRSS